MDKILSQTQMDYTFIKKIEKAFLCCLLSLIAFFSTSTILKSQEQKEISIEIEPMYGEEKLGLNTTYFLPTGDSLKFTRLRFYISNIRLLDSEQTAFQEENSFHLIDIEAKNSLEIPLGISEDLKFDQLSFSIGIDSTTNSGGVMGGDLDPTKGMYWTWQSGYINFKLEGTSPLCATYFNEFQYHIGGYQAPNNTLQEVVFPINSQKDILKITLDIKAFINELDLKTQHSIMTPGAKATKLSELLPSLLKLKN